MEILEEENIIKDIRNGFSLKRELNYTAVKDRVLRDINNLFEHEEEGNHFKPVRVSNFWSHNYIEYEVTVIEIKHYQLKNTLMKLDHIPKTS